MDVEPVRLAYKLKSLSTPLDSDGIKIFELPKVYVSIPLSQMVQKVEVGAPQLSDPLESTEHKVLMVMGETGAGKSTLINGMANYILGVEWRDDFRFKLVVENDTKQTESVTTQITAYTIHHMDGASIPYTLTIIDTPGFGDTAGLERDMQIMEEIKKFFELCDGNGIDHLDLVGLVTKSSSVQLTPTLKYIFSSVFSIFGKDVENNIATLVTFSDGNKPPVIDAVKEENIPCESFFKFNNSALYSKGAATEDEDEDYNEMFWRMGKKSFKRLFDDLEKRQSVSLIMTRTVLENRIKLQENLDEIQSQVEVCLKTMDELQQEDRVLKMHEADINANKDFKYEIRVQHLDTITLRTGEFATNCKKCRHTCHYPCNDLEIWSCDAMDGGGSKSALCKRCKGKCSWQMHESAGERFQITYRNETRHLDDLKKKYYNACNKKVKAEGLIANHAAELEKAQTRLHILVDEARICMDILRKIALKPNPLSQTDYIDLMISAEKSKRKEGWKDRIDALEKVKLQADIIFSVVKSGGENVSETNSGWNDTLKRINDTVESNRSRKKAWFSRMSEGIQDIGRGFKKMFVGK